MAEESSMSSQAMASMAGKFAIPADKWLSNLPIVAKCNVFNGNNLYLWERNIRAVLKLRKLLSHLTDDCPPEDDPNFMRWIQEEEIVFAWLLDSLSPEQNARYVMYDTSKLLWEAISRNHSKRDDRQKIIDLYIKSFTLQQGDRDVLTYSNELRAVFNDLDHCRPPSTNSVARAYEATNRLCQFLQGLRPEFELIRSQLYNREIEPTFDQAVSKVMQEESRLHSLRGVIESTAYATKGGNEKHLPSKTDQTREGLYCTHCSWLGHTKEKCWKLHGRPPHLSKPDMAQKQGGAQLTQVIPSVQDFQKMMQELSSLKSMIGSNNSVIGSTSMVNSGKTEFLHNLALHTSSISAVWILDSGATDHMTPGSLDTFVSYREIASGKHVQTADGTLLSVVGIGTLEMQPIGILPNVLHIPKLCVSLVSVQRLAKMREYNVLFDDINAYLCNKVLGWRIGLAKVQQGLYYLPQTDFTKWQGDVSKVAALKTTSEEKIMEVHMRSIIKGFILKLENIVCDSFFVLSEVVEKPIKVYYLFKSEQISWFRSSASSFKPLHCKTIH